MRIDECIDKGSTILSQDRLLNMSQMHGRLIKRSNQQGCGFGPEHVHVRQRAQGGWQSGAEGGYQRWGGGIDAGYT